MMKKLYELINSHHGKRFVFVILWVFALYFGNSTAENFPASRRHCQD